MATLHNPVEDLGERDRADCHGRIQILDHTEGGEVNAQHLSGSHT